MSELDERTRELIAIGASVIMEAVEVGLMVEGYASNVIRRHVGLVLNQGQSPGGACCSGRNSGCCCG